MRGNHLGSLSFLPVLVLDAVPPTRRMAGDVVEGASDGAGAALDAVAEADQVLLLLLVPLVDTGGAGVVAVLARAFGKADVLVVHLELRLPSFLVVLVDTEIVDRIIHMKATCSDYFRY